MPSRPQPPGESSSSRSSALACSDHDQIPLQWCSPTGQSQCKEAAGQLQGFKCNRGFGEDGEHKRGFFARVERGGNDGVALSMRLQHHFIRYFPRVHIIRSSDRVVHVYVVCPASVCLQDPHPNVEQLRIMARLEVFEARCLSREAYTLDINKE